jgi:hypothetical protein
MYVEYTKTVRLPNNLANVLSTFKVLPYANNAGSSLCYNFSRLVFDSTIPSIPVNSQDLLDLVALGLLAKETQGKVTSYFAIPYVEV